MTMKFLLHKDLKENKEISYSQLAHLQAEQADTQTKACKIANSPTHQRTRITVLKLKIRTLTD